MSVKTVTGLGFDILSQRYLYPGEKTWSDRARVIAQTGARAERDENKAKWERKFFEVLSSGDLVPGGRIIYGSGRSKQNMLNCYAIKPEDSVASIAETIADAYKISCGGGGIGFNFSEIRPRGDDIQNIKWSAPGSVSVIKMINEVGNHVKAGKNRRTALIAILNVDHPDILEFLHVKLDKKELNNFNISVGITDDFIKACQDDQNWTFKFNNKVYKVYQVERTSKKKKEIINVIGFSAEDAIGRATNHLRLNYDDTFDNAVEYPLKAKELWDKLWENAVEAGCPGIYNHSLVNSFTNVNYFETLDQTNPCGELPLPSYGNCCLGNINLSNMMKDDGEIDWQRLANTIRCGIRFLDNILTENYFPVEKCRDVGHRSRRIGLGVMGLHYMLIKAGIRYGSDKCIEFLERLFTTIRNEAYLASVYLAEEKGSFPAFHTEKFLEQEFAKTLPPRIRMLIRQKGIRNAVMLTIPPTGCQKKDTLLVTESGILSFDELFNSKGSTWQPLDVNVATDNLNTKATKGYINGVAKTKKLLLKSGIELECTLNHNYRVFDYQNKQYIWKAAEDLEVGDNLASRIGGYSNTTNQKLVIPTFNSDTRKKAIEFPTEITSDFAKFLGIYYADGSNHNRSVRIHWDSSDEEGISYVSDLIFSLFKRIPTINQGRGCTAITINSVELLEFLEVNGLSKSYCETVEIPRLVRSSSAESLRAFIDGYHLGDGTIVNGNWRITTVSKEMAQQLAVCLRALGDNVRIYKYDNVKGSLGKLPKYVVVKVKYGSKDQKDRYLTQDTKNKLEFIQTISDSLIFDEIVSIEDSETETYDIEVPDGNTYVANTIISHNTISMVMGTSTGIEPIFAPIYLRRYREANVWKEVPVVDPLLAEYVNKGISYKDLMELFVGAYDVKPEEHMAVQATIQKFTDSALSKTINLPPTATAKEFSDIALAYAPFLKGMTVYRGGSKENEPLSPIPVTEENLKKYVTVEVNTQVSDGAVCTIGSGECGS